MSKKQKKLKKNTPKKACTTSINETPAAPLAPTSQQQLNHQINKSKDIIKKQQKIMEKLMQRLGRLEVTVSAMEGERAIVRNVNTFLSRQLDEEDSYSRRSCMIVTGLQKPKNDETNEDEGLNVIHIVIHVIQNEPQKPKNLTKMLRKSPASNV